jgi:hypothetical protein
MHLHALTKIRRMHLSCFVPTNYCNFQTYMQLESSWKWLDNIAELYPFWLTRQRCPFKS